MASVTSIYARAFADAVLNGKQDPAEALRESQSVVELVATSKDLRDVWEAPSIPSEQKRAVLDAIVARAGISRLVRNFVAVLIDHQRIKFLGPIVKQFEIEMDHRLGFAEANITSMRQLSDSEKHDIEIQVATLTGKKVRARYSQDASILGGAIVKVGSTIYDGSVEGQLERIKAALSN